MPCRRCNGFLERIEVISEEDTIQVDSCVNCGSIGGETLIDQHHALDHPPAPLLPRRLFLALRLPTHQGEEPLMFAFYSAANVYMVLLAAHAATSRSAEITLSVSYTGRDLGVLARCTHYVVFREGTFPLMRETCVSPEHFEIIHPGSRLQISGSRSPVGFRATSLRQCTAPLKFEQDDVCY